MDEKQKTRQKLLTAARDCLLENGHALSTIKKIANHAGVNHGLVHHYFGSKESLFLEVLLEEKRNFDSHLDSIHSESDMIEFLTKHLFMNARLLVEFQAMTIQMPEIKKAIIEILELRKTQLRERLNIQDETARDIITSAMIGLAIQYNINPDIPKEQILKNLFQLFNIDFQHNKIFSEKNSVHTKSE